MVGQQLLAMRKISIHSSINMTNKMKKIGHYFLALCLALILIIGTVLHTKTYQASEQAQAISQTANQTKDYLYFKAYGERKGNILFYQGALVEESSYASIASNLSQDGYDVYILKAPLNLPILAQQKALNIIEKKNLDNVYLAGHSLGGVVASLNAEKSSKIQGLILLASYPSEKTDLSSDKLRVLSITATNDKVLKWQNYENAKKRLPESTQYRSIEGGNHGGFGDYGQQSHDGKASLTSHEQNQEISQIVLNFLNGQA